MPYRYAPVSSTVKPVTILSLPAESLSVIFHYLDDDQEHRLTDSQNYISFTQGGQFPHNVALVCKGWRCVAEAIPSFWVRIMFFLDDSEVHKDLERQFGLSQDHPINVYVIRRNYPEEKNDFNEHLVVDDIVSQLAKHVHRCKVLVFDVLHSTSVPLVNSFSGTSKELLTLRIRCRRGPASPGVRHRLPPAKLQPFICPNLRYIDLQGRAFIEAKKVPQWLQSVRCLPGKALSISDLTREEAGDFDFRALINSLACIGHMTTLTLKNLDIDLGDYAPVKGRRWHKRAPATIHVQNFEFFGLSGEFVQAFFLAYDNKFDVSSLSMTQCGLGRVNGLNAWQLSIRNCSVTEAELLAFLEGWDGFSLELCDVSAVTDQLFKRLTRSKRNMYDKQLFAIPTLRVLNITSQTPLPLSPEMLKEMVFARKREADRYLNIPSTTHFLPLFTVTVIRSSIKISGEDRRELADALEEFYWASTTEEKELEGNIVGVDEIADIEQESESVSNSPEVTTEAPATQIKEELVSDQPLTIDRSDSPVLDSDCADWDFSHFDDSGISALIPPSAASQAAVTLGSMNLHPVIPVQKPSRSPSPVVKDDYCDMDWSSLDV